MTTSTGMSTVIQNLKSPQKVFYGSKRQKIADKNINVNITLNGGEYVKIFMSQNTQEPGQNKISAYTELLFSFTILIY